FRSNSGSHGGIIGGVNLLDFNIGFFNQSTQVSVQTCTDNKHMAVMIALYLICHSIGPPLDNSISGAIWTQKSYSELLKTLGDTRLATCVYSSLKVYH
ncbi:hypothetical protein BABINDRAFT_182550, partial [Babjeviella inositovora NRRL Y-12698]